MIRSVYSATSDTVTAYVSVMPNSESFASMRFPGALWAASGGGGGSGGLEYVTGSASCPGAQNDEVQFNIRNSGSTSISVSWLVATYSHTPTSYFQKVWWGSDQVFNSPNPRAASGDMISFNSNKSIGASSTETIRLEMFRDSQSGGGSSVDMTNTDFTITFSDGSVITFNSGT